MPLLFACLKPFLLPSSNRNTLVFVFNIPMKIKGRIPVLVFRVWTLSPSPSTKNSFTIRSPTNHWVGAKNERFNHPWEERKVNEKLTNTYLHTRPFPGEKRQLFYNDSQDSCRPLAALKRSTGDPGWSSLLCPKRTI